MAQKSSFPVLIHETNAEGQHRIVKVMLGGLNECGEWVEQRRLAVLGDNYANSDPSNGLPAGIFRTRGVPHQVLV